MRVLVALLLLLGGFHTAAAAEPVELSAEAAREILDSAGLSTVPIEEVAGRLSDHYDPSKRALFLSSDNYHGRSIAAVGVAAHEAGPQRCGVGWGHERVPRIGSDTDSQRRPASADAGRRI